MEDINKIEVRGRIQKIELKMVNYKTLAQMLVETNHMYNNNGEAKMETTWHRIEAWENTQVKDLTKLQTGSWVRVIGRVREKSFQKSEDKTVRYMEVYADYVKKLPDNTTDSMNKIELIGTVTAFELKIINNKTVGNIRVLTRYVYNSKGEDKVEKTYHQVEAWATPKIKDLAKISVGNTVRIVGRYRKKTWEKDGEKFSRSEVYADDVKKIADN